jgi:chromosome partitioning protein
MKTITLLNEKGGVGKTSLSVHIAAGLAIRGRRVVLMDADAQANATTTLGFDERGGLYDLLVRDSSFSDVMVMVPPTVYQAPGRAAEGELLLIPSNVETRNIAGMLASAADVRDRVADLKDWADVVIFDTAPTPSLFHAAIYVATDGVICPTMCEQLSLEGLAKSMSRLRSGFYPAPEVIGIIPTMHRPKTALHQYNLQLLKDEYGALVWPELQQRIAWSEASQLRQTVFAYDPDGAAAADMWQIIEKVEAYCGQGQAIR